MQVPYENSLNIDSCTNCPILSSGDKSNCCAFQTNSLKENDLNLVKSSPVPQKSTEPLGIKYEMNNSNAFWKDGSKTIPCGTQTLGKGPIGFIDGVAPKYLSHGKGGRVWDVDGNEYIDCWLACLPITFGYCNKTIDDSIIDQLKSGISFSLMHPLEVEAAKLLIEDIPIAEQVRFAKNGSDVCEAAVRLARFHTGRDKVITIGYHGFHDWYISSTDRYYGIPEAVSNLTLRAAYNDIDGLAKIFSENKDEIACLIMEPTIFIHPKDDYLNKVKEMVHSHGALLIFDEMLTGYRFSRHGAMSFFGVEPDLATFGKGIANGMPIGMLVGPERLMSGFEKVFLSSTYGGETLSLAATVAGLRYHREHDVIGHLWKIGKIVLDGFNQIITEYQLIKNVSTIGYPVRQTLQFKDNDGSPSFDLAGIFQQEMLKAGILSNAGLGFCHAHTEQDAQHVLFGFQRAAEKMAMALKDGELKKYLEGIPATPVFKGLRDQKVTSN